jgi:hypothetical protein
MWQDKPNGTKASHWIDLIADVDVCTDASGKKEPCWWYEAAIKFDGCIHIRTAFNSPFPKQDEDQEYYHICDIDKQIELLQQLRLAAKAHFGDDWPT